MMPRDTSQASELIAEPQETGVVQVRRSVVFLASAIALLLLFGLFWYVVQRPIPQPRTLGQQYRPADVTVLDRDYGRHSVAVVAPAKQRTAPVAEKLDPCILTPRAPECSPVVRYRARHNRPVASSVQSSSSATTVQQAQAAAQQRAEEQAHEAAAARESSIKVDVETNRVASTTAIAGSGPTVTEPRPSATPANTSAPLTSAGAFVLARGMSIPLTLVNSVDSTLGGTIVAQVSEDVYDAGHRAVLIPRGSKAIGEYSNATAQEQARLYCTIDTIQLPNYTALHVDNLPCADMDGKAGIPARVDAHRGRAVRDVGFLSALAAGAQLAQPATTVLQAPSVGSTIAGSVGAQIANLGTQELSRSLALGPALHVDEGTGFAAIVKTDILAQPYR